MAERDGYAAQTTVTCRATGVSYGDSSCSRWTVDGPNAADDAHRMRVSWWQRCTRAGRPRSARFLRLALVCLAVAYGLPLVAGCNGDGSTAVPPDPVSGAGSRPTATAPTAPTPEPNIPPRSIETGEWEFLFRVVTNSCGGDPGVGTVFDFAYYLDETREPRRGYLSDGDPVRVSHVGGTYVANLIFTWPDFTFDYPIDGGHAYVTATFNTATTGVGSLTEAYDTDTGSTCSIFLRDDG